MSKTPAATFLAYAREVRAEVDTALDEAIRFDEDCPELLRQAIAHSLLAPGKRLRPLLVVMAAELCGADRRRALPAAVAVEMIHTYSLIHDDLPAMDDDDMRRGRPTCHKAFGEAMAILAGDGLLARAFEILARQIEPPETAAACVAELARASGVSCLVGGQADDLSDHDDSATLNELERIHHRKTGALIAVSLRLGGLIAGATATQLAALERYGRHLGMAFQITDDLLDVGGDVARLGKRTNKDAARGKLTFPGLLGVEASWERARKSVDNACAELDPFSGDTSHLIALARYVLDRDH